MDLEKMLKILEELGQKEIIEKFKSVSPQEKEDFVEQINILDKACRGGLKGYLKKQKLYLKKVKIELMPFMSIQ
jgi:hypothetical protein